MINRERRHRTRVGNMRVDVLQEAVAAVIDACSIQVDIRLEVDGFPAPPADLCKGLTFGSSVALTSGDARTGWSLALVADEYTCKALTRALFAMDEDQDVSMADMADAMGEIPNVAAGAFKAGRAEVGETLRLGLPIFSRGHSHLTYLPFGVNAVAQTIVGDNDLVAHVVLVWRDEGDTDENSAPGSRDILVEMQGTRLEAVSPITVLTEAVESVIETCRVQIELPLEKLDAPYAPRSDDSAFGSSIPLTSSIGGWNLALFCNRENAGVLTRTLFEMQGDEDVMMEDLSDAMGEIVNVAAGAFRKTRQEAGQEVQLGLPLFIEGNSCVECLANGIQGLAQTLKGPNGFEAEIILIWQEGNKS